MPSQTVTSKTIGQFFCDWHAHVFGFGYGTGEPHTMPALRKFLELCPPSGNYDYQQIEAAIGPVPTWLLINILCGRGVNILNYGTSPRYGWLTSKGIALRAFVLSRTADDLIDIACPDHEFIWCYPDVCNCSDDQSTAICPNPFFHDRFAKSISA